VPFDASPFVLWPFGGGTRSYRDAGAAQLAEDRWERRRELAFAPELNRAAPHGLAG
jgi:hypothetical protein